MDSSFQYRGRFFSQSHDFEDPPGF